MKAVVGALVGWELGLVGLLVLLLFGSTLLGKWGRSRGQLPRAFRRGRGDGGRDGDRRG